MNAKQRCDPSPTINRLQDVTFAPHAFFMSNNRNSQEYF